IVGGVFAVALLVYATSDFSADADKSLLQQVNSIPDAQQRDAILAPVKSFIDGLHADRQSLFLGDILRSLLFALVVIAVLYFA
ncbi:hypothetical protein, partial [Escherichia coli]|uniref:hypothetical protein n=1 Tax=Escherichia coli TaxID=562 RepID=UPI0013D8124E